MKKAGVPAGLLLACLALATWVQLRKGPAPPSAEREQRALISEREAGGTERNPDSFSIPSNRSIVEPAVGPFLHGVVQSAFGDPIANARVKWIALAKEDTEPTPAWPEEGWGLAPRAMITTWSDASGAFRFEQLPSEDLHFGSVVVVTHENHRPGGTDLEVGARDRPELVIELEPATPVSVFVLDAEEKGQPEAIVHHVAKPRARASTEEAPLANHERFYWQESITDGSGRATLVPFRGEQALWATKGELITVPWQGLEPAEVVLRLGESFTIGGRLSIPDWSAWDPDFLGERRILVTGQDGNLMRPLARLRGVSVGDWGPLRVPLGDFSRYVVRLEGLPIVPIEESFESPLPFSHHRIDFAAEKQADIGFMVQDEFGKPIPTATGLVWWDTGAALGSARIHGAAKATGAMYIGTFPPGYVWYRISAPGFASQEGQTTAPLPQGLLIVLQRGGSVRGRCTHDSRPVQDFEVIFKSTGNISIPRSHSFFGRKNGEFELAGMPPGDWSIQAACPEFPASKPVTIRVVAEDTVSVELELPTAIPGSGRVVDAETQEPLPDAWIQPYSTGGVQRSLPWGPPVRTAADGTFSLSAFVLGTNEIQVEADGFASAGFRSSLTDPSFLDWGDIRLHRPQALILQLHGIDQLEGLSLSDLDCGTAEGHILPRQRFDDEGVVRFEGVPPGDHRLMVFYPDDSWAGIQLNLVPGADWTYHLRIAGEQKLSVRVLDQDRRPLQEIPLVMASGVTGGNFVVRLKAASVDGSAAFEGIEGSSVQVWAFKADGTTLASKDAQIGSGSQTEVELLVGEPPFRILVLDADEAPLPAAHVTIRSPDGVEILAFADTGSDGRASLQGIPPGQVLLDVKHGSAGSRLGVPITASTREFEFVLDAHETLEFQLVDGEFPLDGVIAQLQTTSGLPQGDAKQSDGNGVVRFGPLGEGQYHLAFRKEQCWPVDVDQALLAGKSHSATIQMRRLATAELLVTNSEGIPVSGVEIDLRSVEFDVRVRNWISKSLVRGPDRMTTDTLGRIHLAGLPNGEYAWSVALEEVPATGSFSLLPGDANQVLIPLP